MSPFREPGDKAPPEPPPPPREITVNEVTHQVAPHSWGRHRCPFCGSGRPFFLTFWSPERGIGKFVALTAHKKSVRPVFQRECGCGALWYVEPKESFT